ncbi:aldo/keto reductase [Allomuricauda sp. NBRC 101325]|uniref:aldo/keto reductase n=1 Tax=Allomuricauda sp. NBRC 101325 TaxID=1113758 RepID=UPI0024A1364D|nr:aldo/keto reductase [Muricauda sp. NBRC 101325]GLU45152.1 aldehyde oxidase [Muricauda sp. NBRC 101325]
MKSFNNKKISRRTFAVQSSLAGLGLALGANQLHAMTKRSLNIGNANLNSMDVKKRKLGSLEVYPVGIGCMNAAWGFGDPMSKAEAANLFRAAADYGQNFFDTAEVYGAWTSEEMVGKGLKGIRKDVIVASKFGFAIDDKGGISGLNSRPENIRKATEGSLKRLQTDYIDLLYQHRVDPEVPIEDVAGTVKDLIKEGKVREFGLSGVGAATVKRAHKEQAVAAIQNEYSVWTRDPEGEILDVCEELGIALVPWAPMGKGYLAGTLKPGMQFASNDRRSTMPRFTKEAMEHNWAIIELLSKIGEKYDATPGQINLAWLLHKKPFIAPIPGTTKLEHLKENMKAATIQLTSDDMKTLEDGLAQINIMGERAAAGVLNLLDIGNRGMESSEGTHGLSPLRKS